jgi:hypothetical protein
MKDKMIDRLKSGRRFLLEKIIVFCIIFFYIFATRINVGGGINLAFVSILLVFIVFLGFVIKYHRLFVPKTIFFLGLFLLILALYHLMLALIYGNDFTYFMHISTSILLSVMFGWSLSFIVVRRGADISNLIDMLILVSAVSVLLNSVVIIFEHYFPVFKVFLESLLLNVEGANIDYAEHLFRHRGLSAAGGAGLSVLNALAVLLFIFLMVNKKVSSCTALFSSLIIVISTVFIARTGLIFGLFFLFVLFVVIIIRNLRSGFKGSFRAVALVLLFLFALGFAINFDFSSSPDRSAFNWAFEWVDGLMSGRLETASSDSLKSMLFLPDNPLDLLFGIGYFEGNSNLYPRTDSGYLKTFLSVGVLLGSLLYLVIGFMFFRLRKVSKKYDWLVVSALAFMFIVEVKEPFLYQNSAARLIFLLSGASLFVLSRRRE